MEFRKILALRGPNIWANFPVLEAWVDLGALKDSPSDELPGFNERLMAWLPTMIEHRCSVGERGGFFERLRRGTYQAHILEHVTLELQSLAGIDGRLRPGARDLGGRRLQGRRSSIEEEAFGRGVPGHRAASSAWPRSYDRPFDVAGRGQEARAICCTRICLGPEHRGRSCERPRPAAFPSAGSTPRAWSMLGHGARQRRILAAETDRTGAIAESIAQDKELTRSLLRAGRRAGPRRPAGHGRRRRLGRGPGDRRPGRRQAAVRQPGPRRGHEPDAPASRSMAAYASAREDGPQRRGRALRPRGRLSPPGRRRPGRRRRPPRAGAGHRRRPSDDRRAGRRGQPRPAPRRRSRHGLEQDRARPDRPARAGRAGLHARLGPAGRATAS